MTQEILVNRCYWLYIEQCNRKKQSYAYDCERYLKLYGAISPPDGAHERKVADYFGFFDGSTIRTMESCGACFSCYWLDCCAHGKVLAILQPSTLPGPR